ncbi:DUF5133 domain-containing protein [Streptomyces sp. NPDC001584]|uniref:DUF5133 domain-containing protein n=1 Tax=Streptomyces sp. NPDC001584 TaxID=3154521 RepID=UPI0033224E88
MTAAPADPEARRAFEDSLFTLCILMGQPCAPRHCTRSSSTPRADAHGPHGPEARAGRQSPAHQQRIDGRS